MKFQERRWQRKLAEEARTAHDAGQRHFVRRLASRTLRNRYSNIEEQIAIIEQQGWRLVHRDALNTYRFERQDLEQRGCS